MRRLAALLLVPLIVASLVVGLAVGTVPLSVTDVWRGVWQPDSPASAMQKCIRRVTKIHLLAQIPRRSSPPSADRFFNEVASNQGL